MPYEVILKSVTAGLLASVACGFGVFPLVFRRIDPGQHTGIGYGLAGGMMFAASVYNLILPGLTMSSHIINFLEVWPVIFGILLGAGFLWSTDHYLSRERMEQSSWKKWGGKTEIIIFVTMMVHSIPEGVAVGVGYASEEVLSTNLGTYIAVCNQLFTIYRKDWR